MLYLRIMRGPDRQEYLTVPDRDLPFTIGRDRENKLCIENSAVSRFHAVLLAEGNEHYIKDLKSTNGTFLRGKKIKKTRIHPGDKITIADVEIIVGGYPWPLEDRKAPLDLTVTIDKPIATGATLAIGNADEGTTFGASLESSEGTGDVSRSYAALQVLYRADQVLRDIEDFRLLLENFMDLITEVIPSTRGYIFLIDRETGMPIPYVRRAPDETSGDTEIAVSRTILKTAVDRKESIISNDALVDERFIHSRSLVDRRVRSAMCAPLVNRGKVLGIIYLDSVDKANLYTKDDLSLLSAMALKAGIALDNAQLYDDMRSQFFNTVETLVRAIQARDHYTSGHSARVSRYALLIAERLGLSTKEKHHLYLTSMLHDIGKIGLPDKLLNRPGKLTEEEIRTVRDHVKVGASMLKALGEMHPIVPLILHHHEAYDGSGYPDGLEGDQIPLISRIVAVADTFDAMTSDRPYRKARSRAEAIAELKRCAGKNFDPKVVNVLLEILGEMTTAEIEAQPQMTT